MDSEPARIADYIAAQMKVPLGFGGVMNKPPDPAQSADLERLKRANLGLATTHDLLTELYVRFEIPHPDTLARESILRLLEDLPDRVLDYRTVEGS